MGGGRWRVQMQPVHLQRLSQDAATSESSARDRDGWPALSERRKQHPMTRLVVHWSTHGISGLRLSTHAHASSTESQTTHRTYAPTLHHHIRHHRHGVVKPAEQISSIVHVCAASSYSELSECSICLEELNNTERCIQALVCTHAFHADCIDKWMHKSHRCPVCRSFIKPLPPCRSQE